MQVHPAGKLYLSLEVAESPWVGQLLNRDSLADSSSIVNATGPRPCPHNYHPFSLDINQVSKRITEMSKSKVSVTTVQGYKSVPNIN